MKIKLRAVKRHLREQRAYFRAGCFVALAACPLFGAPRPSEVRSQARSEASAESLTISPTVIDFKRISVGKRSKLSTVTLTNSGADPIDLEFIGIEGGSGQYAIITNSCGQVLQPGSSCALGVGFFPYDFGVIGGEVYLKDTASDSPQTVMLYGYGAH